MEDKLHIVRSLMPLGEQESHLLGSFYMAILRMKQSSCLTYQVNCPKPLIPGRSNAKGQSTEFRASDSSTRVMTAWVGFLLGRRILHSGHPAVNWTIAIMFLQGLGDNATAF
ncbi:hypothetical protein LIA77_06088 [Sarocladium implicatum]|nr:hypothetical protein LIA77_06088 [Sarocladium implicatum]